MTEPEPGRPPRPQATDDLALVRRMALRDEAAAAELYDRYAVLLLAIARRILGPGGDAEEVLQESFLQAWFQADRYDPSRSSVATWLVLIARSRALDRLRTVKARGRATEAAGGELRRLGKSSAAESHVLDEERRQRVRRALAELPRDQQTVIELAFYEGLSQTEIAARTGAPLGTVKTRALLAMKKLRQELRAEIRELM